ncbi:MAG: hypothetical protein ACE5J7_01125 [Candidatus Aenigmatarchaeota archaeon]
MDEGKAIYEAKKEIEKIKFSPGKPNDIGGYAKATGNLINKIEKSKLYRKNPALQTIGKSLHKFKKDLDRYARREDRGEEVSDPEKERLLVKVVRLGEAFAWLGNKKIGGFYSKMPEKTGIATDLEIRSKKAYEQLEKRLETTVENLPVMRKVEGYETKLVRGMMKEECPKKEIKEAVETYYMLIYSFGCGPKTAAKYAKKSATLGRRAEEKIAEKVGKVYKKHAKKKPAIT